MSYFIFGCQVVTVISLVLAVTFNVLTLRDNKKHKALEDLANQELMSREAARNIQGVA